MNIWIVAPPSEQPKLVEPLRLMPYRVFGNDSVQGAFEALPEGLECIDLFVLAELDGASAVSGVMAIRAHSKLASTPILVVGEKLGDEDAAAVKKAGADACYRLPFKAPVYSARVRAAAAVKR